jgi:5,10-methylenetetrahydromethanopterin reductase
VLGIGNLATLDQYAITWQGTRPIARLREAHAVIRTLLDQGSIDFHGDFFDYTGVTTAARPTQEHVPVKLGAMAGPKSMELAGEIADGLHAACAYSPDALRYAVDHVTAGADRAGRDVEHLDLGDSLLGAIAADGDVARRAGRILAAFYIRRCRRACSRDTASSPRRSRRSTRRLPRVTRFQGSIETARRSMLTDAVPDPG